MTRKYNITLFSDIGKKKGYMWFETECNIISGTLFLMNTENNFIGEINKDKIFFEGVISSLLRSHKYTAEGIITDISVIVELKTAKNKYLLKGEIVKDEAE